MSAGGMQSGSRISQVLEVLLEASTELERGLLLHELVEAYRDRRGPVESNQVSSDLNKLRKRGLVLKGGGRLMHTLWVHADAPFETEIEDDPARILVDVVNDLARATGQAQETSAVHEELRTRGVTDLSTDQVRTKLKTLAHTSAMKKERSHEDWEEPRVQMIVRTSGSGRRHLFWAPAHDEYATPEFLDRSDAIRYVITTAEEQLGRPPSKDELRAWAYAARTGMFGTLEKEAAEAVLHPSFLSTVDNVSVRGRSGPRVIRAIRTPWTSRGEYRCRYSAREPAPLYDLSCFAEDWAILLRPSDEHASIDALSREAEEFGCDTTGRVASTRKALLARVVISLVGDRIEALPDAIDACIAARAKLRAWAVHQPLPAWKLEALEDDLALDVERLRVLKRAAQFATNAEAECGRITAIDGTEGWPLAAFEDLAAEANNIVGSDAKHWMNQLTNARRVWGARAGGVAAATDPENCAWLDRPDAISSLVRECHLPEMMAYVAGAEAVMGYVLRDADWILETLNQFPDMSATLRQSLTVALGLLGTVPPLEAACPSPADFDALGAYLAAVALGVDDDEQRHALAEEADLYAEGAAMGFTDLVLGRIESGQRISALG